MAQSMTAFARLSDQGKWGTATWEIRAVNHRYLDTNFRLPEPLRHIEHELREMLQKKLHRGKIDCSLKFNHGETTTPKISLNTDLIKQLAKASKEVNKIFNNATGQVNPMHILSWNDALHISEQGNKQAAQKIIKLFDKAIDELVIVRKQEGKTLKQLIKQRLQGIMVTTNKIKKVLPQILKLHQNKLEQNLAKLKIECDNNRLEQEMAYFAQKTDIAEELDRLQLHVKEVQRVLQKTGPIGKRLDFLMQELNREANTLASKSVNKTTTHAAVELKVLIEQMREQIQNIE